jgi:hypothetical protein
MGKGADDPSAVEKPLADSPVSKSPGFCWTGSQRKVLIVAIIGLLGFLSIQLVRRPLYISDPQPDRPARYEELADRIDPNSADVAALSALPMIGPKRAADIVRYREKFVAEYPGKSAFERPEDLLRIDGIGAAMLASLRPYLILPVDRPAATSQPIIDGS